MKIIDISQPVSATTACFPGDIPFSREITLSLASKHSVNLTALRMSPHVGTHTDSPVHVSGDMSDGKGMVGNLPLEPFVGAATVIDIAPCTGEITREHLEEAQEKLRKKNEKLAPRVLFKTCRQIRYDVFEEQYAYFSSQLIDYLFEIGTVLAGIDTPSVDHTQSKALETHHRLITHNMTWLENLDLTGTESGQYFLVALPIKFMELEASPVRAILLDRVSIDV